MTSLAVLPRPGPTAIYLTNSDLLDQRLLIAEEVNPHIRVESSQSLA